MHVAGSTVYCITGAPDMVHCKPPELLLTQIALGDAEEALGTPTAMHRECKFITLILLQRTIEQRAVRRR